MNKFIAIGVLAATGLVVGGSILATRAPATPAATIVSQNGLHWHATLIVREAGTTLVIPANLGLGVVHNPIHTHDDEPGLIHMEFDGRVTEDDLRLKNFFTLWGKEVPAGATMTVNGEPNVQMGQYSMRDGDVIEIRY